MAGYKADARSYSAAAQILSELNVRSIVLLANSESKADDLSKEGVDVNSLRKIEVNHADRSK